MGQSIGQILSLLTLRAHIVLKPIKLPKISVYLLWQFPEMLLFELRNYFLFYFEFCLCMFQLQSKKILRRLNPSLPVFQRLLDEQIAESCRNIPSYNGILV